MYNYIPSCITWAVNNKCTWEIYEKTRDIDSEADSTTNLSLLETVFDSTEPQDMSIRDQAIVTANQGIQLIDMSYRLWIKDLIFQFNSSKHVIKMSKRITPFGVSLAVWDGYWTVLSSTTEGLNRGVNLIISKLD